MATIKAPSMRDPIYVGTHGNLSIAKSKVILSAAAVGDIVEMLDIPIGLDIQGLRVSTSGLGENVKADIKLGDTTLAEGIDLSGEYSQSISCDVYIEDSAKLTVTIKGAGATGTLRVNPEYIAKGY